MHSIRLAARRSRAQSGLLSTVGAVLLVLTALEVGLIGYLDYSGTTSARALVAGVDPTARSIRVETKLADEPAVQTAAATTFLDNEFAGLPVAITRTLALYPLPTSHNGAQLTLPGGDEARITAASDPGLEENATLVEGNWPAAGSGDGSADSPAPGALQADAAKQLGLTVGDVLSIGTGSSAKFVAITGTWRASDEDDSRWFADPGVATGNAVAAGDGTASFGPLMLSESELPTLGPVPSVRWTIAVDTDQVTPAQLDRLGTIATQLLKQLTDVGTVNKGEIIVDGTLAQTALTVHANVESVRGVTPVGTLLVGFIGIIALVQLARLLSRVRRPENALLRSRGASARWLTVAGIVEAAFIALLGCGIGFALAAGALSAIFGLAAVPFAPWEFAVLSGFAVLAIFGTTSFFDSIRLARRDAVDDSGRSRTAATVGTTVLALAAAGLAVWQSLLYGSPLITDASGHTSVNPLAVVAPALALIAIALVVLVIFGPLTAAWQRIAAARRGLQPSYSARQVARGLSSYAVAVLVVALGVGGLVVASTYSGSWRALTTSNGQLVSGADARVMLDSSDFTPVGTTAETGTEFRSIAGVTAAAPVFSTRISIGDNDSGRLTAIPHDAIESVVTSAGGAFDKKSLAEALKAGDRAGIPLPEATTSLALTAELTNVDGSSLNGQSPQGWAQASLWLRDSAGSMVSTPFPRIDIARSGSSASVKLKLNVDLPPERGEWSIVAIDYSLHADDGYYVMGLSNLEATTTSGTAGVPFDTTTWGASLVNAFGFSSQSDSDSLRIGLPGKGVVTSSVRFVDLGDSAFQLSQPGVNGSTYFTPDPLPIVVSQELSDRYDIKQGAPFTFRFAGSGLAVDGTVAAVVPLLPGIQSANSVFVEWGALNDYLLLASDILPSANQVWVATNGTASLGNAFLGSALPDGATVVTAQSAVNTTFAAPAEIALWIAALGSLLLAAFSLGAVALTVSRVRRGEVAVLRAVGISARQQSRGRLAELSAIILISVLFGVLGGLTVSIVTVPNLAHSAVEGVPAGLRTGLGLDYTVGGALFLGTLVVLLGIAAVSARRVRRKALDTSERLETR